MSKDAAPEEEEEDDLAAARKVAMKRLADRWVRDAPEIMQEAYRIFVGLKPPESWSWVVRKSSEKLAGMQADAGEHEVARFLRESMLAFCLRCGGSYQVEPTSPFFADTYLFSQSALDYLERHQDRVRKYSYLSADPEAFPRHVYGEFLASEQDYWILGAVNTAPDLSLTRPSVYWVLLSNYFGRFDEGTPLDDCWHYWDYEVDYMGRPTNIKEAWQLERIRLKRDSRLLGIASAAAVEAIQEAASIQITRLGIGQIVRDGQGRQVSSVDDSRCTFYADGRQTLREWELDYREYLCGMLGLEWDRHSFQVLTSVRSVRPVETPLSRVGNTERLSPFLLAALDATEGE